MRCAEENDTVRRDIHRSKIIVVLRPDIVGIQQCSLGQDTAQTVSNPDDGILQRALALAVVRERGDEGLSVVVDEVVACAAVIPAGVDIGVIAVDEHVGVLRL